MQKQQAQKTAKPGKHLFGAHLSIAGGLHNALTEAVALKCDTVQVFVKNQRQWQAPPLTDEQIGAWHAALPKGFGPTVAHATYLINLASAKDDLWQKSIAAFTEELRRCDALGIAYLVVHPGSPVDGTAEAGIVRVAEAMNKILADCADIATMPLLENTAGQGKTLGRTFAELGAILAKIKEKKRVGVCVDSCHAFAAGYDIRDAKAYADMKNEIEAEVGVHRVRCWHLNDSKMELGTRRDRHDHIGVGCIGRDGFRNILRDPDFLGLPMIIETPKENADDEPMDAVNLQRLRRMSGAARSKSRA